MKSMRSTNLTDTARIHLPRLRKYARAVTTAASASAAATLTDSQPPPAMTGFSFVSASLKHSS